MVSANFRGCPNVIHILNVYAPYKDRASFWEPFITSGILDDEALLIAGDLNCTMGRDEVWGRGKKADSIGEKMKEAIMLCNLLIYLQNNCLQHGIMAAWVRPISPNVWTYLLCMNS